MKHLLLVAASYAFTTPLFCQEKPDKTEMQGNNRLETFIYENGENRTKLTISAANDTLLAEEFYMNGIVVSRQWRHDSMHKFDNRGNLRSRYFGVKTVRDEYNRQSIAADSSFKYHANGQPSMVFNGGKNKLFSVYSKYTESGKLDNEMLFYNAPFMSYRTERDAKGSPFYAFKTDSSFIKNDTIERQFDTLFHSNGQIRKILILQRNLKDNYGKSTIKQHDFFDRNGQLIESIAPRDSFNHTPFKDNLSCLYGFKNEYDDTLIAPKYEQIVPLDGGIYAVYEGANCQLIRNDGTIIPTPKMTDVGNMQQENRVELLDYDRFTTDYGMRITNRQSKSLRPYFFIKTEGKTGVIDRRGASVISPQYLPTNFIKSIKEDGSLLYQMSYVGDADYLAFSESKMNEKKHFWEHKRTGFLNKKGEDVFGKNYKSVAYSDYPNHFIVAKELQDFMSQEPKLLGLADGNGQQVLNCQFEDIKNVLLTPFFITTIKSKDAKGHELIKKGLFDVANKKWVLDTNLLSLTVIQRVDSVTDYESYYSAEKPRFFIFQDEKTRKCGLLDGNAQILRTPQYDTLGMADVENHVFFYRMNNNYRILKLDETNIKRGTYDYLMPVNFPIFCTGDGMMARYSYKKDIHFMAKRNNKWGIIRADNEAIAVDFTYDYAAISGDNFHNTFSPEIYLFKDNQAVRFDMFSFPKPNTFKREENGRTETPSLVCPLVENAEKIVFLDTTGKVIIPPQYRVLELSTQGWGATNFALVEDAEKRKKIVLLDNARMIDFPFDYRFVGMHPNGKIMMVQNEKQIRKSEGSGSTTITKSGKYGIVSTDGRVLLPCENFAIALSDAESNVFFAKKDSPNIAFDFRRRYCPDTLNAFDSDWMMYNKDGKLLNPKPFNCPIIFKNGVGIGIQNALFGIFKSDGTALRQPNSPNIWYENRAGFYMIYERRGLTSTVEMMNKDGEIRVKSGKYDGISMFFGKYALVSSVGRIGLIDTFGREIVAPQDLKNYDVALVDSLQAANLHTNKMFDRHYARDPRWPLNFPVFLSLYYGFQKAHPDSLKASKTLRAAVWNALIETATDQIIRHIGAPLIDRSELQAGAVISEVGRRNCQEGNFTVIKMQVSDNFIAFVSSGGVDDYYKTVPIIYHNFYRKNGRWERLNALSFFKKETQNQTLFYDKLVQKIRALHEADIDCGNVSSLMEQAQNQFMMTEKGIVIHFNLSQKALRNYGLAKNDIEFSWAELKPFLAIDFTK
jgi:hypothetical protein